MKKLSILTLIAIFVCIGVKLTYKPGLNLTHLALKNLALIAKAEGEGGSMTGPRDEVNCSGVFSNKHKMVCRCFNEYSCEDSDCY
jgi:hypothetical protein